MEVDGEVTVKEAQLFVSSFQKKDDVITPSFERSFTSEQPAFEIEGESEDDTDSKNTCTVEVSNHDTSIEVELKRDDAFDIEGESSDGMQLDNDEKACNDAEFYHSPKKKGKWRSTVQSPTVIKEKECCRNKCLSRLNSSQIEKTRETFQRSYPSYRHQRGFVFEWFQLNQPRVLQFTYRVCGISTCYKAWIAALGIPRSTFFSWKKDYCNGRTCPDHGAALTFKRSDVSDAMINFLQKYFEENCDYLPTKNLMHLPASSSQADIYFEAIEVMKSLGQICGSLSSFKKIWKQYFPQVKIPKADRFSQCDTCCNITQALRNHASGDRSYAYTRRKEHREFVRQERGAYMNRAALAHRSPHEYFSIAVDGMDQSKTEIPNSKLRFKALDTAWKLKIHIVGTMVHGRHPICFIDYHQHPHDSNLVANIILQTLWIHKDYLPRKIFLQLDNTYRDNKNQYILSLMAYLVDANIFDVIEVSFLPKGHTHIDVDQLFSRISVAIAKSGCLTYKAFPQMLRCCYKQNQGETTQDGATIQYAEMDQIYAIREWIIPHMTSELHWLRDFHHFKFTRNNNGKCQMFYKAWCRDKFDNIRFPPLILLKSFPQDVPEIVAPLYHTVDFRRMRSMVERCNENGVLNQEQTQEWWEFLEREETKEKTVQEAEVTVYSRDNGNATKQHKPSLQYLKCHDKKWIVDDLIERQIPTEVESPPLDEVLRKSETIERGEGLLPIYQGRYIPNYRQRNILPGAIEVQNGHSASLEVGALVAVNIPKYRPEKPQIGRVLSINESDMEVLWLLGTWTGAWKVFKKRQNREMVEVKEVIPTASVLLAGFNLTQTGKLKQATKDKLKPMYDESSDDE